MPGLYMIPRTSPTRSRTGRRARGVRRSPSHTGSPSSCPDEFVASGARRGHGRSRWRHPAHIGRLGDQQHDHLPWVMLLFFEDNNDKSPLGLISIPSRSSSWPRSHSDYRAARWIFSGSAGAQRTQPSHSGRPEWLAGALYGSRNAKVVPMQVNRRPPSRYSREAVLPQRTASALFLDPIPPMRSRSAPAPGSAALSCSRRQH